MAGGLSSNWGEVVVNNVEPGKSYDLNKEAGTFFTLKNNFDSDTVLKLQVLEPQDSELKPGYEPIPDVSWISVPKEVKIGAMQEKTVPIQLRLPADAQLKGRKFHVWVWSYTFGQAVGVGLKSRILINVSE